MKLLQIAGKDLLRSVRNKFFFMFGLGVPLLMATIFYLAFGGLAGDEGFNVPQTSVRVANLDRPVAQYGDFSAGRMLRDFLFMEEFAQNLEVSETSDAESARAAVDDRQAGVAVIIPEGLSASIFDPQAEATVEVYRDPTLTLGPGIVESLVTQFVDALAGSKIAAAVAAQQMQEHGQPVDPGALQSVAGGYSSWVESLGGQGANALLSARSPVGEQEAGDQLAGVIGMITAGMMVFYAFFTGAAATMSLLEEEESGVLPRLFTTPTPRSAILGGKFISVFAVVVIQVVILTAASSLIFGVDWGAPLPAIVTALALVIVSTGFGIFITSLLKDTKQTGIVYGGVMTVMGMIGMIGVFTANAPNLSPAVEILPLFVPQGWAVRAWQTVMDGGGVGDILTSLVVMTALGIVFFVIGVLKFRRRFA